MFNLNEILKFEYQSEHVLEHDLQMKKNFSLPKIYTANGNLKKRWYVYFSFRNPETGKLDRMKNIYGTANTYKTKEDRLSVLTSYRKNLIRLLKLGFNPFEDNVGLFQKNNSIITINKSSTMLQQSIATSVDPVATTGKTVENDVATVVATAEIPSNSLITTSPTNLQPVATNSKTLKEAIDFVLTIKEKTVANSTYKAYKGKTNTFQLYIAKQYPQVKYINQLTKKMVLHFLNDVLQRTTARTRNNTRVELSSVFQTLEDNEIIDTNFIKNIPVLRSTPERNKTYTNEVQENIFKFLEEKDPNLLLYIKFISYNFLRPIEVNRLKVGDINLKEKTLRFKAKNSPFKTKIIPDILINDLPDLSELDKENPLFTPKGLGKVWETSEINRRGYFTKQFKDIVKSHFNLSEDYGLYSFRHTYITKLYRELVKQSSPFEAKSRLMLITGHTSMTALEKYLRDIDAELPEDYSNLIK